MKVTLKEAIREFPEFACVSLYTGIPENFNELSFKERLKYINQYDIYAIVKRKEDSLFFGIKRIRINRFGHNIFTESSWQSTIFISNNKVKVNSPNREGVTNFFSFINRPIVEDLDSRELPILYKPFMIKAILCNKVYSMETFYREYMKTSYHLTNFDWKVFRAYIHCEFLRCSILDLMSFTKDLRASMLVLIECSKTGSYTRLQRLEDLLKSAVDLDEIVDFEWSDNRVREEHLRQTRTLMANSINSKQCVPIYDTYLNYDPNIKLLNTEQDVYMEGMVMHHCLYTCYWRRIENKDYIAFHMKAPEDCTFSVRLIDDKPYLDQIFLSYDRAVQDSTREIAKKFMLDNSDEFKRLLKCEILPF